VARDKQREQRRRIQMVFQNPRESLNPRHTVLESLLRPAMVMQGLERAAATVAALQLATRVRLSERLLHRYPAESSPAASSSARRSLER
jgi:peptide/nickel transport system ATP-binding protein